MQTNVALCLTNVEISMKFRRIFENHQHLSKQKFAEISRMEPLLGGERHLDSICPPEHNTMSLH